MIESGGWWDEREGIRERDRGGKGGWEERDGVRLGLGMSEVCIRVQAGRGSDEVV